MKVKECMCNKVEYLSTTNTVKECAELMSNKHIGCVPVCDKMKNIVGLVTDRDLILRSIACGKDAIHTPLKDVMSTTIYSCPEDTDVEEAQKIMSENQIRRLPITDENRKIVGIVTLANLCANKNINTNAVGKTLENICDCDYKNAE